MWKKIDSCPAPGTKKMFVVIGINVPNMGTYGRYTTDPVTTWRDHDGSFPRWNHEGIEPTHWCELPDTENRE